jgi:hypothetical protein
LDNEQRREQPIPVRESKASTDDHIGPHDRGAESRTAKPTLEREGEDAGHAGDEEKGED